MERGLLALRGLSQHQVGVPRRAVAQRRAGDDGHVQKARIAQKPAQRRLFYQRIMERRTVPAIPSIDENDKLPFFLAGVQCADELVIVRLLFSIVRRLGQHQNLHLCLLRRGDALHAEIVDVLIYDFRQGLIVILTGGLILRAAKVGHEHMGIDPGILRLGKVQLCHRLEGQIVHAGENHIPLPQPGLEIGDFVFLNAVLGGGIVNADEHMELAAAKTLHLFQQRGAEGQLIEPVLHVTKGAIIQRISIFPLKMQQIVSIGVRIVSVPDVLQCQLVAGEGFPGCRAHGPHGVVVFQCPACVAHGGGKAHYAVQQPYLIVRVGGQRA